MRKTMLALFAVFLGLTVAGCLPKAQPPAQPASGLPGTVQGSDPVTYGEADNGGRVELKLGRRMKLSLAGNMTTGYSWAVSKVETSVLTLESQDYDPDPPAGGEPVSGGGGTATFIFLASNPGTTTLELRYVRPWEKDQPPANTFGMTVVVK
jgi:inhibitor of cysteine peptidase